ncbi:MAG: alpha/beta hydrolase [Firmicutes bacterium]|nr:alpha/beta hydrolase [Bacillota bacterium]
MTINANGTDIFYKRHLGGRTVVLLHGWGGTHKLFDALFDSLSAAGCDVISLDLPGFGDSAAPSPHFTTDDYADCVRGIIEKLGLCDVTVVGHSFGGRLAILLGVCPLVSAIVLVDGAGIKPRFSFRKWLRVGWYKRAKKRGSDLSGFGSADYKALSGDMREIFVRVVNRHLDNDLKKINVPTLLIWGKNDKETPLYMAKRIKRVVKDCGLVVLEGGHFAYLENSRQFCAIVRNFVFSALYTVHY